MQLQTKSTPRGTAPQPERRSTKHKRPSYGEALIKLAGERRARRALRRKAAVEAPLPARVRRDLADPIPSSRGKTARR